MKGFPPCSARPRPGLTPAVDEKGRDYRRPNMALAGLTVPDTALVRDAIELSRSALAPYLFNHVMRSWLFSVLLSLGARPAPDPELLALSVVLHDLGLSDRYAAADRFEVDGG